jgi:hypothetical protein
MSLPSYSFGVGVRNVRDGMCDGLCHIGVLQPLTPLHVQRIIDAVDMHVIALLPSIVDVSTLLQQIQTDLRGSAVLFKNANLEEEDSFANGWSHVQLILSRRMGRDTWHQVLEKGTTVEDLVAFLE